MGQDWTMESLRQLRKAALGDFQAAAAQPRPTEIRSNFDANVHTLGKGDPNWSQADLIRHAIMFPKGDLQSAPRPGC